MRLLNSDKEIWQKSWGEKRKKKKKETFELVNKVCRSLPSLISHTCPFRTGATEKVIKFKCAT